MSEAKLSDDVLRGVPQIAEFLGEPWRRTYHLIETKAIPCGKIGGHWVASKTKLRQFYDKATGEVV